MTHRSTHVTMSVGINVLTLVQRGLQEEGSGSDVAEGQQMFSIGDNIRGGDFVLSTIHHSL